MNATKGKTLKDLNDGYDQFYYIESSGLSQRSLNLSDVANVEDGSTSTATTNQSSDVSSYGATSSVLSNDSERSALNLNNRELVPRPLVNESIVHAKTKREKRRMMEIQKYKNKSGNSLRDLKHDLEKKKIILTALWKEEFEAERKSNLWHNRIRRHFVEKHQKIGEHAKGLWIETEIFIENAPLTIGAIALSWVMMGMVWFKCMEEFLPSCRPVQFWSSRCRFRELPGCFYCSEIDNAYYKIAHGFRYGCNIFAAILISVIVSKCVLAWKIVQDDLSNPTTSAPFGLIAMGTNMLADGHGLVGQFLVMVASLVHLCLFFWFLSMAYKYRMLPDPSWFPNTVCGFCCAATKVWLHVPVLSFVLLVVSTLSFTDQVR